MVNFSSNFLHAFLHFDLFRKLGFVEHRFQLSFFFHLFQLPENPFREQTKPAPGENFAVTVTHVDHPGQVSNVIAFQIVN